MMMAVPAIAWLLSLPPRRPESRARISQPEVSYLPVVALGDDWWPLVCLHAPPRPCV